MSSVVLDASALIAVIRQEPGAPAVEAVLESGSAVISTVTLSEAVASLIDRGMTAE